LGNVVVKGTYNTSRTNLTNSYTISGVTLTNPVILTANFYDNYNFMGISEIPNNTDTQYNAESGFGACYGDHQTANASKSKGLLTGTLTAQLNPDGVSSKYLYSVMYYDYKGRVIQTKSNNHLAGGLEKEYFAYNFTGQPTGKKHIHSATGKTTQTEVYAYNYDHAGRLLKTAYQLNNGTIIHLSENAYDELGRLKINVKGGQIKLRTTYVYNIRSWVKSITAPLFAETLYYNESYGGSAKLYNGNISAMNWKLSSETVTRGYAFSYNNLSWLTAANYLENGTINSNYKTSYTYDNQGNMKLLQRYGKKTANAYGLIDNLTMTYTGNRLRTVWDAAGNVNLAESSDFKEYANDDPEYSYNANGAMTQDLNKGISEIQYNVLNLPKLIVINSPVARAINGYVYSASGVKLNVLQRWDPNLSTTPVSASDYYTTSPVMLKVTDYAGNMIYEDGKLKRILIDGGYIEGGVYHYYLTDHLGNNRLVVNSSGTVVQKNHYYPFGMAFAETSATEQGKQPYKFGNKELDQMHGLNQYDYSTRYYDPAIARFTTPDPLAEKYYNISPYAYCLNNPIRYVDLRGDSVSVNQTITNDFVLNKAFELFANSKEGRKFLANYASKGQTIAGHTFTKGGKYDKKGINLEYTTFNSSDPGDRGQTTYSDNTITVAVNSLQKVESADGETYDWSSYSTAVQTANQMTHGILSRSLTFFHESFIHADLFTSDYLDDKQYNYSNIPTVIKQYTNRWATYPETQYHHMYVGSNINGSTLWPASAYRGIIEVNSQFGQKYTNSMLKTIMWKYNGGK